MSGVRASGEHPLIGIRFEVAESLMGLNGDITADQRTGRWVLADLPADEQRPAARSHAR
jgi:hypothetical protein